MGFSKPNRFTTCFKTKNGVSTKAFSESRLYIPFGLPAMSKIEGLNGVLEMARVKEKKYEWLDAAKLYAQAFGAVEKKNLLRMGKIQEKIGHCFYRAAFQAESQEEFKRCMSSSVEAYGEAAELFERSEDPKKQARIILCRGMKSFRKSWLAEVSSERKALLDECWKLEKDALKVYEETGDKAGYGKACNELLVCLYDRSWLAWDLQELKNIEEVVIEYGEKAIEALSEVGDEYELARAYFMLAWHCACDEKMASIYESIEKQDEVTEKALVYAQRALEISEKTEDPYLIGMSNLTMGSVMSSDGDFESSTRYHEKALELGKSTRDNLVIAIACGYLAYEVWWKMNVEEDPEKRRNGYLKAFQYAEDAITHYHRVSYPFMTGGYFAHIESHLYLANDATNVDDKLALLVKSIEVGRNDFEQARNSGSPEVTYAVSHSLSKALYYLSIAETKIDEKRKLLEEASKYREEEISVAYRKYPFTIWNRGVSYSYSALIKAELAKIETNPQEKTDLVIKAVLDMETCLKLCDTAVNMWDQAPYLWGHSGTYRFWFGGILEQLYLLTGEKNHLERAIRVYEEAVQVWGKADLHSRMAETYWKVAKLYDHSAEYAEAAREFESASKEYRLAAEKIPQLKTLYTDHEMYMQAWSEIEKARHHHRRQEYGIAKEHFAKAADIHKSLRQWSYLAPNYSAWALVERAEELSREEQSEEALQTFEQAAQHFTETEESLQAELGKIVSLPEKQMATNMLKVTDLRHEYCKARIALEEARILDKKGDHHSSSEKYGSATETFTKISQASEFKRDQKEFAFLISLSKAWQKMTLAEAETSPTLYTEASKHFEEARDLSSNEKSKMLLLGHSRFCRALEAGTRFEDTRDEAIYSAAKKHMEAAENYYLKAGFKNASDYAKATYMVFDAYMYTHKAETETNPVKKAQYYQMAEKLLQTSAGAYMKAKHPEKSEEVKRLLEGVKEKRQLALSLSEVLHAPQITSTTTSFSTPTPTDEQAVGLERFEHADIQANLILRVKEVNVGEDVSFEMELINAGKAPALLVKVENVIPESFEVRKIPATYRVEDSFLNMKGKRLNPLKTEDVKIVVKPRSKGTFIMKPRVLYVDETGKYKFHEPEPLTITVKELGIKGWIKGER